MTNNHAWKNQKKLQQKRFASYNSFSPRKTSLKRPPEQFLVDSDCFLFFWTSVEFFSSTDSVAFLNISRIYWKKLVKKPVKSIRSCQLQWICLELAFNILVNEPTTRMSSTKEILWYKSTREISTFTPKVSRITSKVSSRWVIAWLPPNFPTEFHNNLRNQLADSKNKNKKINKASDEKFRRAAATCGGEISLTFHFWCHMPDDLVDNTISAVLIRRERPSKMCLSLITRCSRAKRFTSKAFRSVKVPIYSESPMFWWRMSSRRVPNARRQSCAEWWFKRDVTPSLRSLIN